MSFIEVSFDLFIYFSSTFNRVRFDYVFKKNIFLIFIFYFILLFFSGFFLFSSFNFVTEI